MPPHIRAGLTAMLPPTMRAGLKAITLPASPSLRLQTTTPQAAPVFALPETEKIFGALKAAKKLEEVVEKVEVRMKAYISVCS